jgi:hypothetical protein
MIPARMLIIIFHIVIVNILFRIRIGRQQKCGSEVIYLLCDGREHVHRQCPPEDYIIIMRLYARVTLWAPIPYLAESYL